MKHTLSTLWRLLDRRQRRHFLGLSAFAGFNALLEAVGAALLYSLIGVLNDASTNNTTISALRRVLPHGTPRTFVYALCIATGIFFVAKNLSVFMEIHRRNRWVNDESADVSCRLLDAYLHSPLRFHQESASAELTRTAMTAIDLTYRLSLLAAAQLLSEALASLTLVAVLVVAAPALTPVLIVVLGSVVAGLYGAFRKRIHRWGEEGQVKVADALRAINESLGGIRDVKLLGGERFFIGRFRTTRRRAALLNSRIDTLSQASRLVLEAVFVAAMIVLVIVLTARNQSGAQATSILAIFGYAGFRLMPSANRVLQAMGQVQAGAAAIDLIDGDLRLVGSGDVPVEPGEAQHQASATFRGDIEIDHATFSYVVGERPVVDGVDLSIPAGSSIGIVGSSGSGKSTLVDIISGLLPPTSGTIRAGGIDIATDPRLWRRQLGYVSQLTFLRDASIRENVAFAVEPSEIDDDAVRDAVALAQLTDFVATLDDGLDSMVGENGVRLSGGQRQRIAIARALYHRPSILIFDEATSALDNQTEAELTAAIDELAGDRTVIVVAHRLSTVRRCDQVVLLHGGRIIDGGTFDELSTRSAAFQELLRHNGTPVGPT